MYNFTLVNCDTDSISVCKQDMTEFSEEEQIQYLKELNEQFPEHIKFEPDGLFQKFIVLKAKNYIMYDGKKIIIKGSGLRDQKRPQKHRDFYNEIIDCLINDKLNYTEIYNKYVKQILTIDSTTIKSWSTKKSYTEKIDTSDRTNETKVKDCLIGSEYRQGDKIWVFYKEDKTLSLSEKFSGDYNKDHLLKGLHSATKIFGNIINIDENFINYSLKKNKVLLEVL
jgi:DNA polymerase elongation subunit (family B)